MFDNLTERLSQSLRNVAGTGKLTEDNIKDTLREVRMALLEADVALTVVKDFIERIRSQALGQEVMQALSPGQAFVKLVFDELVRTMGDANEVLNLHAAVPPAVVLMAGLQGAGKTTTVAKLAKFLQERHKKKVLVVSCDIYRPAAIKQLETVATDVGAYFYPSHKDENPIAIAQGAIAEAKRKVL
jgi:signal recognition particle subunit SRP54